MSDVEREMSRVLHDLPEPELGSDLLSRVHRRIAHRRRARYSAAAAVLLLASGGVAVGC